MQNKEGVKNAQQPKIQGFQGYDQSLPQAGVALPATPGPTPIPDNGQFTGMTKRQIYEWNKARINGSQESSLVKAYKLDELDKEYLPLIAEEEKHSSTQGYSSAAPVVAPKVPTTGTVPAKTGNKVVDAAVKKFDTQGTDVKKLESFWDRAAKFFTGGKDVDVSVWDFLEATGRAMSTNNNQATTREKRKEREREDVLINADLASKKAEKEGQFANQIALQKMADQSAMERLQAQKQLVQPPNPGMLGANLFPGGQ